jgi:hypothetical protein
MSTRGLVVTPHFTFDGQTLHFPGLVGLEADDLRQYLLYWDRIDWPDTNFISVGSSPDVQFLEAEGILTRTRVQIGSFSGNAGGAYVIAQMAAFRLLSAKDPGQWALGQTTARFFAPTEGSSPTRVVEVELYGALPIPPATLALQDVLDFKAKRASELLALRGALDELYLQIADSADIPRAKDAAITRLKIVVRDLNAVATASWGSRLLRSLKVEVKIPDIVVGALGGAAVSLPLGVAAPIGLAAGAVAAAIKFESQSLRAPSIPNDLRAFAYLYHMHRDLAV